MPTSTTSGDAGRIAPLPKGDYVDGTAYEFLDIVAYDGSVYMAKTNSTSILPTDTTKWMRLMESGVTPGNATITIQKNGTTIDTFTVDQSTDKTINVSISASDVGLGSVVNTGDSATPVENGTTKLTTGGAYTALLSKLNSTVIAPAFDSTATYAIDDTVTYNGNLYKFIAAHTGTWSSDDVTTTTLESVLTIDDALSSTSTNTVQNKVVKGALDLKANSADLATVATSGSFSDLSNTPTVDSALSNSSTNAVQNSVIYTALSDKADDSDVVHLTGAETITGVKTFNDIKANQIASDSTNSSSYDNTVLIGEGLTSGNDNQVIIGRYNESTEDAFVIANGISILVAEEGGGSSTETIDGLNVFSVDWEGNVTSDGEITDGDGNVLSSKADNTSVVHLTGAETIAGAKTFSSDVTVNGSVTANNVIMSSGADYAERFEELETCPPCRFVTLDGEKIKLAQDGDFIGIVSQTPFIIGDKDINGIPVGLVGKLVLEDDGTCEVNGFATSGKNGIGTKGETGCRVMSRIDNNHVKVLKC